VIATSVAATQLGNARRALDEARAIVETKKPALGVRLAESSAAQRTLTETEGRWQAGMAVVELELGRMWGEATRNEELSVDQRIRLHRANVVASQLAVEVVDAVHQLCGTAATARSHALSRCLRDAQALRAHVAVGGSALEQNAMLSLGLLDPSTAILV
jgi:3-hydroxy-9,10-secoandrosta-1,3,5(10)-triene-9,17-dione monooxygenase